ncbi:hypothetical protein FHR81_001529 [Actinoalloteichus hoggarensis]|uniref:Uncharacterized protein n=1 Tax=Actinoalloteichus hoggarensis TaxID=1470176 RepID=A0A221W123_9PSEU|nr:hypothetical protein [Actinoalloteichus hoggarensis]ASO19261.1 hypothetical protein AHOG_08080 [Actinoalloteichus hoggarensis]MBB5920499.1 hypothetical protein [Actinoalloteichus hoggarensis]
MIVGVAVLPHPPLLVPELVTGAVTATAPVRDSCVAAAVELRDLATDWVVIASGAVESRDFRGAATFAGYGRPVEVRLAEPVHEEEIASEFEPRVRTKRGTQAVPGSRTEPDPSWPLPLLIAGWLRGRVGARRVRPLLVDERLSTAECLAEGAELATRLAGAEAVGLLVLGDGSARVSERSPLPADPRAAAFDEATAHALGAPSPEALAALDPNEASDLAVSGRAPWQVLAGAVSASSARWTAELRYSAAPFGVRYHVASWRPVP